MPDDNEMTLPAELYQGYLPGNPRFNELNYEIRLNFTYAEFETDRDHHASLAHEYYHLLQATTTTYGVHCFVGLAERLIYFFNAVAEGKQIRVPFTAWASSGDAPDAVRRFAEYQRDFQAQRVAGKGYWFLDLDGSIAEFDMLELEKTAGAHRLKRWHVCRRVGAGSRAVPLLADALSEAQAEAAAVLISKPSKTLIARLGREEADEQLLYTTVPGLVSRHLPKFPLEEAVIVLSEYGLMTLKPDEAVREMLSWVTQRGVPPPKSRDEWLDVWHRADRDIGLVARSTARLRKILQKEQDFYRRLSEHRVAQMMLNRIEAGLTALDHRERDPILALPASDGLEALGKLVTTHVPMCFVRFSDRLMAFGAPEQDALADQALLSSATHVLKCLGLGEATRCPFADDHEVCGAERSLACYTAPWTRSMDDQASGKTCCVGLVGQVIGGPTLEITQVAAPER